MFPLHLFLPSLARPVHLGSPGLSLSVLLLHLLLPSHPPAHRHPHRQKFHRQPKLLSEVKATDDTCQVIYFIVQEKVILYMMKPSLLPIIYQILCHQATIVTQGFGLYLKAKTLVFSFLHSLCQLRPVQDKNIYTENCRLDRGLTNQHRTTYACVGKKPFETAFEKTQQTLSNTFLASLWKKPCAIVERPDLAWSMGSRVKQISWKLGSLHIVENSTSMIFHVLATGINLMQSLLITCLRYTCMYMYICVHAYFGCLHVSMHVVNKSRSEKHEVKTWDFH